MPMFFARTSLRSLSTSWNAKDLFFIGVIALLALLIRLPSIAEPARTIYDEAIYANNAIRIVEGVPWIDPHPYFARSLFATIAGEFPFQTTAIEWRTNAPFGDFPYLSLRLLMAFFGTLLPVLLYAIGRGLGLAPPWAAIAGVLAAIEPGFVIFSRIMVPDMMLLAFGFTGIALALAGAGAHDRRVRIACALLAGACFGAAIAIKWTALGLLATGIFALLLARRFVSAAGVVTIALGVYGAAFLWFFSAFPMGGMVVQQISPMENDIVNAIRIPTTMTEQIAILPSLHRAMATMHAREEFLTITPDSPKPLLWAVAGSMLPLWLSDDGTRQITLAGNPILWTLALVAFLLALVAAGTRSERMRNEKKAGFGPVTLPLVLVAGYLGNYVPFFLIERPMYLYHYFAALCFLFLALPWGLSAIDDLLSRGMPSRTMRVGLLAVVGFLVILVHLLLAPWVWGW